jgi:NarL family two-component system sensor histidine kinase YdfH
MTRRRPKDRFIGLPLYLFISLLLIGMSIPVVLALIRRGDYGWLALYGGLLALHLLLYWLNIRQNSDPRWRWFYYPAQTVLLIGISLLPETMVVIPTLFIALCGEVLGVQGNSWLALGLILGYALLLVGVLGWTLPWAEALEVFSMVVINGGLVLIILALFNRQLAQAEQLARYAEAVERLTLEAERERMARELHDTLAQGVAGLILQLEAIKAHHEQGHGVQVRSLLVRALSRARSTLTSSRAAISDLRSMAQMDFETAVQGTLDEFRAALDAEVVADVTLDPEHPVSPSVQHHARRVLAEGLRNVRRHADASRVRIEIRQTPDRLRLVIADDGVGFDPDAISGNDHYGLMGLRERAHLTGSRFALASEPGDGTTLRFDFPLEGDPYG